MKNKISSPLELFQKLEEKDIECFYNDDRILLVEGFIHRINKRAEHSTLDIDHRVFKGIMHDNFYWEKKRKTIQEYEAEIAELKTRLEVLGMQPKGISREKLAGIWDKFISSSECFGLSDVSSTFKDICKELGL